MYPVRETNYHSQITEWKSILFCNSHTCKCKFFFSCDSSSISRNVGRLVCRSVCLSVGLSVRRSVGPSVCQQRVLQKCFAVGSAYMLLVSLQLSLLTHSAVIFCNVSRSVCLSATSFMEVLCCCQRINVATVVVVCDIRTFF